MRSVRQHVVVAGLLLAGLFAFPASASVNANVVETQQAFAQWLFNPCTEEPFLATGRIHTRVYFSVADDGRTHMSAHISLQGVEGVVPVTAVRYVVQRNDNSHIIGDFAGANNEHVTFREHYVRLKSGVLERSDDFYAYFRFHLTVNGNGTTTVNRLESDAECN